MYASTKVEDRLMPAAFDSLKFAALLGLATALALLVSAAAGAHWEASVIATLVLRIVHVLLAAVWIGLIVFMNLIHIPAVEAGVKDAMERGPLGFPVVDVAVTLTDGSFHAVDSSELAFRVAGRMAMADALAQAAPYLLEPVMHVMVDTPAGTGSKAGSVLSARRGHILGLGQHPNWLRWERVEAQLPESALHGLDAELRSLSQGLASFTASFDHLAELTGKTADEVVKAEAARAAAGH